MATVIVKKKSLGDGLFLRKVRVLYTELIDAAASQNISLGDALPTGAEVVAGWYKLVVAATSASVTGLTVEMGTSGDTDAFVTAGQILSGSPTLTRRHVKGAWITATGAVPLARFTAAGANLGDGAATALTAGKVDFYIVFCIVKD